MIHLSAILFPSLLMRRYRTTDERRSNIFDDIRFDSEDLRAARERARKRP